jgi:hypothetical protein
MAMNAEPFDGTRALSVAAGLALAVSLWSCGGSGSPGGPSTPIPPAPTPTPPVVVGQGGGPLEAGDVGMEQITTNAAGRLDVTVDWTFATNDIDVLITRGVCSFDQLENGQCNIAAFSVSATAKPERISVSGAAAGTYTLFVENLGPGDDSASYQVVLSPGASSSSEGSARSLVLPEKLRQYNRRLTW